MLLQIGSFAPHKDEKVHIAKAEGCMGITDKGVYSTPKHCQSHLQKIMLNIVVGCLDIHDVTFIKTMKEAVPKDSYRYATNLAVLGKNLVSCKLL
uniref:Uncharacterized protein n=1 Tax=Rhipicephalus zambeziensis TaxID=60191 RepID=A0A224Y7L1_9ACAR